MRELLEELRILTGCGVISDLRFISYDRIRTELPKLDRSAFSLKEWMDAVECLTGTKPEAATAESCYACLLNHRDEKTKEQ